jgi:transposase
VAARQVDPIDALTVVHAALRQSGACGCSCRLGAESELANPAGPGDRAHHFNKGLRWHRHELHPGLQVRTRGLRRYRVWYELAVPPAAFDGVPGRIGADLVARCRELTVKVNALEWKLRG